MRSATACEARVDRGRALTITASDGVVLVAHVYPNPTAAVRLVISHGNGLATRGYRVFWESLCADFEVVLFDVRGHGASEAGEYAHHTWDQFTDDFEVLWRTLSHSVGTRYTVGALHSLSAVTSLLHLREHGSRWDALVLFDPSLPPPAGHALEPVHRAEMQRLALRTLARRTSFDDPNVLARQFARSDAFGAWEEDAPLDMACATLREDTARGTWLLACEPRREADIYLTNAGLPVWDMLRARPCPILIVGGDPRRVDAQAPSRASEAAHLETGVDYEAIEGTGHFLQLEAPDRCRHAMRRFLASCFDEGHAAPSPDDDARQSYPMGRRR